MVFTKPTPIDLTIDDRGEVNTSFQQVHLPLIRHNLNANSTLKSLMEKTGLKKTIVRDCLTRLGYKVSIVGRVQKAQR
jgi:hypothetical protein